MANRRNRGPGFPPVTPLSPLAPVDHPQYLPSSPHNLPAAKDRPADRRFQSGTTLLVPGSGQGPMSPPTVPQMPVDVGVFDAHHYATVIEGYVDSVTQTQNDMQGLFLQAPQTRRNFLALRNASGVGGPTLYVGFGNPASTLSWLALLPAQAAGEAGQIALFDAVVPQNDLYVYATAANGVLSYAFSTVAY